MPRSNKVVVSGGDRESLIRFAAIARLVEERPEGRTRRGAPQVPPRLAGDGFTQPRFTQTRFTQLLLHGSLLDADERVITAIDAIGDPLGGPRRAHHGGRGGAASAADDGGSVVGPEGEPDRRFVELYKTLRAAKDPASVASGVSGDYWPVLRRLDTSRHPIDAVMSASSAIACLTAKEDPDTLSRRDQLAVRRLQRALSQVALRNYPLSSRAIDLMAILCRWELDAPLGYMTSQATGRRLGRAFDRAIRTYVQKGERRMSSQAFAAMFTHIADVTVRTPLSGPHTATTSSASILRLARVIARFEDAKDHESRASGKESFTKGIVESLADAATPLLSRAARLVKAGKWQRERPSWERARGEALRVADIVVRREALFSLYEMQRGGLRLLAPVGETLRDVREHIYTHGEEAEFADIIAWFSGPGRAKESEDVALAEEATLHRVPNFPDLVTDPTLSAATWDVSRASFGDVVERFLPLSEAPSGAAWRGLTRQVAVPTRDLLREMLVIPSSARARTIAETFSASGREVRHAVTAVLEDMLQSREVAQRPAVAKRASWAVGFLGQPTATLLQRTLIPTLARYNSLDSNVLTDIAWAVGDVLVAAPTAPGRNEAMECLYEIVEHVVALLTPPKNGNGNRADRYPTLDPGRLILAQAATHAIAIQADPSSGALLSTVADAASCFKSRERGTGDPGPDPLIQEQCNRLSKFAEWGLQLLDQPSLLSHARW